MTKSKRELLFFVENYKGHDIQIAEMSHPKKHARTYMNRFTINENDQYEISKFEELETDREFRESQRPEHIKNRIFELVSGNSVESLDIFLFGWYESEGQTEKRKRETERYNQRINIYHTITQERFHLGNLSPSMINDITDALFTSVL